MGRYSDDDEDDTFYYRYSSVTQQQPLSSPSSTSNKTLTKSLSNRASASGSGGLAPSKSTVYVSNLDFSLTNSDVFTIFSTFGKVAKVTILRDRVSRESRGVAFVLFVSRDDAVKAVKGIDKKVLNGRTLSASIAADNGRAPEFIKRKVYKDKSRCYECGEGGHLSYECPKNQLGVRERPQPKRVRREGGGGGYIGRKEEEDDETGGDEVFEDDNWASVVDNEADDRLLGGGEVESRDELNKKGAKEKLKLKKTSYFSDESDKED